MKVLVADDDAFYRHSLKKALERWGYEVVSASNGKEALDILQGTNPPRLAILDWMMPEMDGVDVCYRVRQRTGDPYIYILLVTARQHKRDMIAGLNAEADDYLVKPFDFQELRARLQSGQRIIDLQTALASKQQELSHQATHDSLTGLWNRSAILEIVFREVSCAKRMKQDFCLALADIDHFKLVNDTYGHVAGDGVLIEVAMRMQSALRNYDAIGRYGGEEFIIVMPGFDKPRALELAERLRLRVAENPYNVLKKQVAITVSLGVAVDNGTGSVGSLLRAADDALYRAKARGRNCVEVAQALHISESSYSGSNAIITEPIIFGDGK
jgi:two-component system cell cycle response regulator